MTPSFRLVNPRLFAGIQTSHESMTSCDNSVCRCLSRRESVSLTSKDGGAYARSALPLSRLSSSSLTLSAASFSDPASLLAISLLSANRRPSARSLTSEADDETRERAMPASQHLIEMSWMRLI